MERRTLLTGIGIAGLAAANMVHAEKDAGTCSKKAVLMREGDQRRAANPIPLNRERATQVMAEHGLDALIATNERNVFYSTNLWPLLTMMQRPSPTIAVIPRRADLPVIAIAPATEIWTTSQNTHEWPEMIVYTAPRESDSYEAFLRSLSGSDAAGIAAAAPDASKIGYWEKDDSLPLSAYEKRLEHAIYRFNESVAATWQTGLFRALSESGLTKGRIGVDSLGAIAELQIFGADGLDLVDGNNIFRKIRLVKTPFEIAQMRLAAQKNADAVLATARQIGAGATQSDIERMFAVEAGMRGAAPVFVVLDTIGGLSRGEVKEGQPIMIDAVSHYDHYHGDFGRTIVLGEPTNELTRRSRVIETAWDAVMSMLRPGVRYSDIREAGFAAAQKTGLGSFDFRITPHSVGLEHTDEPSRFDSPFPAKDDLVLQENMTMTVDFPMVSPGWGSCHLEDLVLINKDGAEPLNAQGQNVIVV